MICEYCPDGSLQGELKRNREAYSRSNVKTLPKRIKATIADIFEAVSYMHSEGVLHRDIKPDNVVKVWVIRGLYRIPISCAILAGQPIRADKSVQHSAVLHCTCPQRFFKDFNTTRRQMYGV